jgi:general secretion pathway protein G
MPAHSRPKSGMKPFELAPVCDASAGTACFQRSSRSLFRPVPEPSAMRESNCQTGFTLIELLLIMAISLTISALAIPNLMSALDQARIAKAVGDISAIETEVVEYQVVNGSLPNTLADIGRDTYLDPWGNPYQYLNHATSTGNGKSRKDRFLVPLNSDFDLYSMGKDGLSVPPITAKESQDDIIRASDGNYVGLASQF